MLNEQGAPPEVVQEVLTEERAMKLYDDYCEAVGGLAFTGDLLPKSEEFFGDPSMVKQADAWRVAASKSFPILGTESLTFGDALVAIKAGFRVARAQWGELGMWIALSGNTTEPTMVEAHNMWSQHSQNEAMLQGGQVEVLPALILRTSDGKIAMGWVASQADLLSDDWAILA